MWELQLKLICELQGGSFRDKSPQFRTNGLPADDDDDSRSWPSHDILNHVQLDKSLVFVDRLAAGTFSWHSLLHLAPPRPIASNQLNSEKCCSPAPANAAGTIFGEFWSDLSTISVQSVFCWLGRFQEQLIDYWSDSKAPPFATDNQLLNLFIFCIWKLCFIFDHTWNTTTLSTVLICKIWISLMSVKPVVASLKIVPFPFDAQECAILWYTVHRRRCHTFWWKGELVILWHTVVYCARKNYLFSFCCTGGIAILLLLCYSVHRRRSHTFPFDAQEEEVAISHISHIDECFVCINFAPAASPMSWLITIIPWVVEFFKMAQNQLC